MILGSLVTCSRQQQGVECRADRPSLKKLDVYDDCWWKHGPEVEVLGERRPAIDCARGIPLCDYTNEECGRWPEPCPLWP
jgi:hypothetical protein